MCDKVVIYTNTILIRNDGAVLNNFMIADHKSRKGWHVDQSNFVATSGIVDVLSCKLSTTPCLSKMCCCFLIILAVSVVSCEDGGRYNVPYFVATMIVKRLQYLNISLT